MCVRTKTSYGCGHIYRVKSDCYSSDCPGPERHQYVKEGECRECRLDNAPAPRPRTPDLKVRSAQKKRSKVRDKTPASSAEFLSTDEYDVSGGASPWAIQTRTDKTSWDSPHRRRADSAWLSEHEDRIVDLNDRMEKSRISDERSRPNHSREIALVSEDYDEYDEQYEDDSDYVRMTPSKKHRPEVRRRVDDKMERSRSQRHEDRQYSHDSLPDSMPSYRSSPKIRKPSTNIVTSYPEANHEYDYYDKPSKHATAKHHRRRHQDSGRSRSDTYHSHSRSYGYESDFEISPIPPLQMPPPAPTVYDTYDYYMPGANPSGATYIYPEYPRELNKPPAPRPQHYVNYRRY